MDVHYGNSDNMTRATDRKAEIGSSWIAVFFVVWSLADGYKPNCSRSRNCNRKSTTPFSAFLDEDDEDDAGSSNLGCRQVKKVAERGEP